MTRPAPGHAAAAQPTSCIAGWRGGWRRARVAALLACVALAGCKTTLNSNLSEREANEEVALLLRAGIPAARATDPKTSELTVLVEENRFADAVDVLRAHGLPRPHHETIADVFKGDGLVASPNEERARMIYALGEELSRTVGEIDGVLSSRVHIVLPDNDPLRRDTPPASASVLVRYQPGSTIDKLVPQIKMLVANGVAGLTYDKVSVVLVEAALPASEAASTTPEMAQVGGFWVYRDEARTLQGVLAGGAALVLGSLGIALWAIWSRRAARARRRGALVPR